MSELNWYRFDQNNSGGSFVENDMVCHNVLIQAANADAANAKAIEVGIYFNGCSDGRDCDCCGDRWHETNYPLSIGDRSPPQYALEEYSKWSWTDPVAILYYANGDKVTVHKEEKQIALP